MWFCFAFFFNYYYFEIGSHYLVQSVGLELTAVLLPRPLKSWYYKHKPQYLLVYEFSSGLLQGWMKRKEKKKKKPGGAEGG